MKGRKMLWWTVYMPWLRTWHPVRILVGLVFAIVALAIPWEEVHVTASAPMAAASGAVEFPAAVRQALAAKVIVVDAGHGGNDPGAVGVGGTKEKEINLAVALRLQQVLASLKAVPLLTRESDDPPALEGDSRREGLLRRLEVMQGRPVAAFVSIHANKFGKNTRWQGAQTFHEPNGHPDGQRLAAALQRALQEVTGTKRLPQPVQQLVLKKAGVPAATVELGFLSNPAEEARLQDPTYQQHLAEAIALGLGWYFAEPAAPLNAPPATPPAAPPAVPPAAPLSVPGS